MQIQFKPQQGAKTAFWDDVLDIADDDSLRKFNLLDFSPLFDIIAHSTLLYGYHTVVESMQPDGSNASWKKNLKVEIHITVGL